MAIVAYPTDAHPDPIAELTRGLEGCGEVLDGRGRPAVDLVAEVVEGAWEILGVFGSSGEVAELAAALERLGPQAAAVSLLPLPTDANRLLVDDLGVKGDAAAVLRRFVRLSRKGAGLRRRPPENVMRRTVRVAFSNAPGPRFAFTVGLGKMVDLLEATASRASLLSLASQLARGAARELVGGPGHGRAPYPTRMAVDGAPFADALHLTAISTLGRLPAGLRPFGGPIGHDKRLNLLWADPAALIAASATAMLPPGRRRLAENYRTATVQRVDVDLDGGVTLDGVTVEAGGPFALGLRPGPVAAMVVV